MSSFTCYNCKLLLLPENLEWIMEFIFIQHRIVRIQENILCLMRWYKNVFKGDKSPGVSWVDIFPV